MKTSVAMSDESINAASDAVIESDQSFVNYMDMVLTLLTPLSLYSSKPFDKRTNISEQKAEVNQFYIANKYHSTI